MNHVLALALCILLPCVAFGARMALPDPTQFEFASQPSFAEATVDTISLDATMSVDSFVTCAPLPHGVSAPAHDGLMAQHLRVRRACAKAQACRLVLRGLRFNQTYDVYCTATAPIEIYRKVKSVSNVGVWKTLAFELGAISVPDKTSPTNITVRTSTPTDSNVWCAALPTTESEPTASAVITSEVSQTRACVAQAPCYVRLGGLLPGDTYNLFCAGRRLDATSATIVREFILTPVVSYNAVTTSRVELTQLPNTLLNSPTIIGVQMMMNADGVVHCGARAATTNQLNFLSFLFTSPYQNNRTCLAGKSCAVYLSGLEPEFAYDIYCVAIVGNRPPTDEQCKEGSMYERCSEVSPKLALTTEGLRFVAHGSPARLIQMGNITAASFEARVRANNGASVWCTALSSGTTAPTSYEKIRNTPFMGQAFCRKERTCSVRMSGLRALTQYDVYCVMTAVLPGNVTRESLIAYQDAATAASTGRTLSQYTALSTTEEDVMSLEEPSASRGFWQTLWNVVGKLGIV